MAAPKKALKIHVDDIVTRRSGQRVRIIRIGAVDLAYLALDPPTGKAKGQAAQQGVIRTVGLAGFLAGMK